MASYRLFFIDTQDGVAIIGLTEANFVDQVAIREFTSAVVNYVKSRRPPKLLIDFNSVRRLSTEMINGLLQTRKQVEAHDGQLRLSSMRSDIRGIFKVLNLDGSVFAIDDTIADAMDAFCTTVR